MPIAAFESLPDDSRVWVFAAERPVTGPAAELTLERIDEFLRGWKAHGHPLRCGRDWRDNRFLTIAVDQSTEGASGCSQDELFRAVRGAEALAGSSFLPGARIYYRESDGGVAVTTRDVFRDMVRRGAISASTRVFDTSLTSLGAWRRKFEADASDSWHAQLLG